MNVAFDASAILGRSGIERYSRELIRALLLLDEPVTTTLISGVGSAAELDAFFAAGSKTVIRDVMSHERTLGAPLRRLMRLVQRRQLDRAAQDADLIHILGPQKIVPTKRPLVVTIHDLFPMYETMGIEGTLKTRFPKRIARQLAGASAVACPSAYVAGTIRSYFPSYQGPIHVTPLAAGNEFTPTPLTQGVRERYGIERPYILFIGRLDGRKNIDRMIRAWNALSPSARGEAEFVLVIAGGQHTVDRFRKQRVSALSNGTIRVLTDVSTPEMVQLLSSAHALAFATLGEGFGLPVIEAMKCGCPVITSSTTSLPEVGGDAAVYVDPTSEHEISQAMQRCLEDDAFRADLRSRGFSQSASFTWEATARATLHVYQSVVEAHG